MKANEPYGWHCFIGKGKEEQDFLFINGKGASKPDASWNKVIPLYTHPAKEQLTDEDLELITEALLMVGFRDEFINYDLKAKALAILKKAGA